MCVIADFGLAVTHKRETGEINIAQNSKVGTRRYSKILHFKTSITRL